jgi:hypothetical protein
MAPPPNSHSSLTPAMVAATWTAMAMTLAEEIGDSFARHDHEESVFMNRCSVF